MCVCISVCIYRSRNGGREIIGVVCIDDGSDGEGPNGARLLNYAFRGFESFEKAVMVP